MVEEAMVHRVAVILEVVILWALTLKIYCLITVTVCDIDFFLNQSLKYNFEWISLYSLFFRHMGLSSIKS